MGVCGCGCCGDEAEEAEEIVGGKSGVEQGGEREERRVEDMVGEGSGPDNRHSG